MTHAHTAGPSHPGEAEPQALGGRGLALPVAAFVLAALVAGALHHHAGFVNDDALITARYAENLAAGNGLVYNVGERVLGTTTPLWALLLAGLRVVGAPLPAAASILGILCAGWAAFMSVLLVRGRGAPWTAEAFTAGLVATSPVLARFAGSGMEVPLYVALIATFLWLYERGNLKAMGWVGGAMILVRPDAGLVLAAGAILECVRRRSVRPVLRVLPGFLALVVPWVIFATWYYGSPLPNSGLAKRLQVEDWGPYLPHLFGRLAELGPLAPLALIGLVRGLRDPARSLPVWTLLAIVFGMALGGIPGCGWYMPPPVFLYVLLAADGGYVVAERVGGALSRKSLPIWGAVVVGALLAHIGLPEAARASKRDQAHMERHHGALGDWLRENAPEDAVVGVDNLGYIGWNSGLRMLEIRGLVQEDVRRAVAEGRRDYAIREHRPDYVVMWKGRSSSHRYAPDDAWFVENGYRQVFEVRVNPTTAYVILGRL